MSQTKQNHSKKEEKVQKAQPNKKTIISMQQTKVNSKSTLDPKIIEGKGLSKDTNNKNKKTISLKKVEM